jgi:hypothetical protein
LRVTLGRDRQADRDFFISYTQADRAWAEWMAWVLEEDGYKVLIQAWDFVAGSNWVQGMRAGVSRAARTIALLSPDYIASEYGAAEWEAAWASDPLGAERKLLTVRVKDCDRPDLLGAVVSTDLFGISETEARARLRMMVSSALTGRAKPAEAPGFPGDERAIPREPLFPGALPRVPKVPARNEEVPPEVEEAEHIERLISQYERNLRITEMQLSQYAPGEQPLHLINQVEGIKNELRILRERLSPARDSRQHDSGY